MRWVLRAMLVADVWLVQPWTTAGDLSPFAMTLRGVGLLLFAVAWATWMIRTWRSKAYRAWARPARWSFLGVAVTLACFGGATATVWYAQNIGWPTTIWLIGWPFIYGLLAHWPRNAR